jgi:O-antigen ligase
VAVAGAAAAAAVVIAVAVAIGRRRSLLGVLAVAALPFRIPIDAGGTTSNLLVPLYLVVAAGSLSLVISKVRERERAPGGAGPTSGWVERLLALFVVLYALQSIYSTDFEKALQQMVFFYVPFALLFGLLKQLDWTPRLLGTSFAVVVGLALLFAAIGFVEYSTKTILLNPKLVVANDLHTYFTVNSVFFDPDIFGRFLALAMIGLAALLVYERATQSAPEPGAALADSAGSPANPEPSRSAVRRLAAVIVALAVLWCGLVLTLSRSSLGALLVGLATLAALRWRVSRALAVAFAVLALGALAVVISPETFGLNQGLNGASSGRANLVTGGANLFADRPVWGYGSGSFVHEYRLHNPGGSQTLSASHTIPITIGAEQGVIGELAYLALVIAASISLLRGARADPTRAAVAAAFLALVFHTLLYADFLEDPVAWALLGVGCALSARTPRGAHARAERGQRAAAIAV